MWKVKRCHIVNLEAIQLFSDMITGFSPECECLGAEVSTVCFVLNVLNRMVYLNSTRRFLINSDLI